MTGYANRSQSRAIKELVELARDPTEVTTRARVANQAALCFGEHRPSLNTILRVWRPLG